MELGTSVQQAVDLHLFLFDRALHPELFRHYADYRVNQMRYHADIWVTGLSHVVTVTAGQRSITELVCPDNDVPTRGIITRFRMKGERDLERRSPEGWHYMVSSQVETMDEPLYKSVHNDLLKHGVKKGWLHTFEQLADGGDMVPFTYIDHEAWDGEFHVHAFHAFPAERTIVKTQTIFELPSA